MILYEEKNECCGCTACKNACPQKAITMEFDEEGFLYPVIDENKCIDCGICKKVCAFQNGYEIKESLKEIEVYATKTKNDEIRKASSSGGMFTIIANEFINSGGVIYGVAFEKDFEVAHIRAENEEQLARCRGSKYSQSDMKDTLNNIEQDLENGKKVLFTGTPCQVAGLNRYLEKKDTSNLMTADIICHGTPSPKLFREYIKFIEKTQKKTVVGYKHRSKTRLTGGHIEEITYANKKVDSTSKLSQTWKRIFYSNLAIRPCCYSCKYTNAKRPSDITIADFWGIEKFNENFYDKLGISLVILNTKKGKEIFEKIEGNIEKDKRKIEEARIKNPQLERPIKNPVEERKLFWELYQKKGIKKIIQKYGDYTLIGRMKHQIKRIILKKE